MAVGIRPFDFVGYNASPALPAAAAPSGPYAGSPQVFDMQEASQWAGNLALPDWAQANLPRGRTVPHQETLAPTRVGVIAFVGGTTGPQLSSPNAGPKLILLGNPDEPDPAAMQQAVGQTTITGSAGGSSMQATGTTEP